MSKEYEHTPREMAEKLMEFNRDFSDNSVDISEETIYLEDIFAELQKSNKFDILAHHLDEMFMNSVFE
uniref:hypothetical protein n=1 Tax=Coprococcus catus TaxID=116085 RepID=UPI0022E89305|nr:hypothetical protein [Coprococcus catus]